MEHALAYDELELAKRASQRTRTLRRPAGRKRDSSIVGIYRDALRHKDGSLTVAYNVEAPATMFADDALIDIRYDDLSRMLAFEKPACSTDTVYRPTRTFKKSKLPLSSVVVRVWMLVS